MKRAKKEMNIHSVNFLLIFNVIQQCTLKTTTKKELQQQKTP